MLNSFMESLYCKTTIIKLFFVIFQRLILDKNLLLNHRTTALVIKII